MNILIITLIRDLHFANSLHAHFRIAKRRSVVKLRYYYILVRIRFKRPAPKYVANFDSFVNTSSLKIIA